MGTYPLEDVPDLACPVAERRFDVVENGCLQKQTNLRAVVSHYSTYQACMYYTCLYLTR
jgi:hypothetical protein